MTQLRALLFMTAALSMRLLREPQVLRSLVWPYALVVLTMGLTIGVFVFVNQDKPIAVHPDVSREERRALTELGHELLESQDPAAEVRGGAAWIGYSPGTLHRRLPTDAALEVEAALRRQRGAQWLPATTRPEQPPPPDFGGLSTILGLLFALYGVVFGAGMVARDADEGTLDAELALPLPAWVIGASRWLAGAATLSLFSAIGLLSLHSLVGLANLEAVLRNTAAASVGSVAIGLAVIGRNGLKEGFSGPLSAGLTLVMVLSGLGAYPPVGAHLPIASLIAGGSGWTPLATATAFGLVGVTRFHFVAKRGT